MLGWKVGGIRAAGAGGCCTSMNEIYNVLIHIRGVACVICMVCMRLQVYCCSWIYT
jgi:hypothetical protein